MAGHSKWANIKRRKGAQDAKRAKIFTKLIKEITVATREGGDDPDANARLRLAIQNAKGANMPKDTIERAIQKVVDSDSNTYIEPTYEGYGSHAVPIFIECATDNLNRSVQNIRSIFSKNGGSLGTNGSLDFIFDRKGVFVVNLPTETAKDSILLKLIDAGAEEIEEDENVLHITCPMEAFGDLNKTIESLELEIESAQLERIPNSYLVLEDEALEDVMKLIDALEDDDDVQKVYHNIEFTDSQMEKYSS
ncbi:YebC/PmpR family DNA-binding transcriptional regulator [Fulvivirgaceae bacterium LMO-SS25]